MESNERYMVEKHQMKLSIITINYNNNTGLRKTLESIYAQTHQEFEHIIVDGGSTDGSVDVIKQFQIEPCRATGLIDLGQYQTEMPRSMIEQKWVSEPDNGIYNAMNNGICMATGDYLLFLNSGDWLAANDVIKQVMPYLNNENDIVSGELELVKSNIDRIKLFPPRTINLNYCINEGLTHPNTFIKKELFDKYGHYNEQNKIISDWEFFLIACGLHKSKYQALSVLISCFDMNGLSNQNEELLKLETQKALQRLLPWWKKLERFIRKK